MAPHACREPRSHPTLFFPSSDLVHHCNGVGNCLSTYSLVHLALNNFFLSSHASVGQRRFSVQRVALLRRATFSSFRITKLFTMLLFAGVWGVCQKNLFCGKRICVLIINGPNRWDFMYKKDTCAFTHEHPRTRRCTIHPRTLTTSLTKNTTNHCTPVHTWISFASVCIFFSRIRGCASLNLCWSTKEWVVAALGRRWTWRLWRATCRRASRRVPSPKTVGGQAAVFLCKTRSRMLVRTQTPITSAAIVVPISKGTAISLIVSHLSYQRLC